MADLKKRAIRHMYRSNPIPFMQLGFRVLHPGINYQHNWSIDILGEALARCHRRETTRLIINMPPRSLKSICASVIFPSWVLGVQPESKILCIAGNRSLADEQHHLAHSLMTHDRYRGLFPHVRTSEQPGRLKLQQGGIRHALTPTGSVTGKGADMIIIDDPQSPSEADIPSKCKELNTWYDRNIYQRLNNKHDGVIIVVMQRLSEDDLTAHLLKQEGWEVLNLPAIAEEDEYMPRSLGGRLARRKGEALHPTRESREELREALVGIGANAFISQYLQNPYPRGHPDVRGGAHHIAPHPDATEEECRGSPSFFSTLPESHFVLERVFGEQTCVRPGSSPQLTAENWIKSFGGEQPQRIDHDQIE